MQFQISRNGQMYGPYTLEDLQRYLASGNVLPTDLAKSEEMTNWLPVSQILAGAPPPAAASEPPSAGFAAPSYAAPTDVNTGYAGLQYGAPLMPPGGLAGSPYPDAPNLHWGLVLLFDVLTCGMFMFIWNLVIASWLKRVQPNATSLYFYAGAAVLYFVQIAVSISSMPHYSWTSSDMGAHMYVHNGWGGLIWCARWIVKLIARFSQRASLEEHFNGPEPVGLRLDAVMTFFFGGLYFQAKLNEINAMKQGARYGAVRPY